MEELPMNQEAHINVEHFDPQEEARRRNNPENLSAEEVLRKVGRLSNELVGGKHPAVPEIGLQNGTFAGSGTLNVDNEGNVILTRVADHEDHLTKNLVNVDAKEMIDTSMYSGGGQGLPTSGLADWTKSFKSANREKIIGTFRIPIKAFLEMVKKGDAVLGNIGEGEIVLNPSAAKEYLFKTEEVKDDTEENNIVLNLSEIEKYPNKSENR